MFLIRYFTMLVLLPVLLLPACSSGDQTASPTASSTTAIKTEALTIAWIENGDLMTWRADDPVTRRIASGGVIQAVISPDGQRVAYLRGPEGDTRSLWISDTLGANERQVVEAGSLVETEARRLSEVVWAADSTKLYFTTIAGEGMDSHQADDLWQVDVDSGAVERLLADGEGGAIFPSPDGQWFALTSAGTYQDRPGAVAVYQPVTRQRTVMLEYPAVATGSEWRWHAQPRWKPDSSGVNVAVPPADLLYEGGDTALWWLPLNGQAAQIGQVDADFFGLPTFSADGEWISYIQHRATPDQNQIVLMTAWNDGSNAELYAQGDIGSLTPLSWLPAGHRFLFMQGAPGELWIGAPGQEPQRFPAEDVSVNEIVWANADTYVFSTLVGDAFTLNTGLLDDSPPWQTVHTTKNYLFFDALIPQ